MRDLTKYSVPEILAGEVLTIKPRFWTKKDEEEQEIIRKKAMKDAKIAYFKGKDSEFLTFITRKVPFSDYIYFGAAAVNPKEFTGTYPNECTPENIKNNGLQIALERAYKALRTNAVGSNYMWGRVTQQEAKNIYISMKRRTDFQSKKKLVNAFKEIVKIHTSHLTQ